MKNKLLTAAVIIILEFIGFALLSSINPDNKIEKVEDYQHVIENDRNPLIGSSTIPTDYVLQEDFVTHLPLVVIDLHGNTIPNIYKFTSDGMGRKYTNEGLVNPDPWASMSIKIIDNENHENHLFDKAEFTNNGKIKIRGMTSRKFEKKQYGIKLMDGDEELEESLLGMEADEDWVLSNSLIDMSGIRNYITLNIGRQIFPFTSEVRFCEVVFKDGNTYSYQGLYLLLESVKKADGRINIADYDEKASNLSYVICRDRYDTTKYTLSTWASDSQICRSYFTMVYPKEELISDDGMKRIEDELSQIEFALYSDESEEFLKYREYLDVESFVDYFVFNEYFMSYDPGTYSTYYYKNKDGKLAIGPLWDYDNAIDNYAPVMGGVYYAAFMEQPWFERLIMDEYFQNLVVERYEELRKSYFSDEYMEKFIDETYAFLGNASDRDFQRWNADYKANHLLVETENSEGIFIKRNEETVDGEIQRIKDRLRIHSEWLDEALKYELAENTSEELSQKGHVDTTGIAAMCVLAFGIMMIVLMRFIKGEYR